MAEVAQLAPLEQGVPQAVALLRRARGVEHGAEVGEVGEGEQGEQGVHGEGEGRADWRRRTE